LAKSAIMAMAGKAATKFDLDEQNPSGLPQQTPVQVSLKITNTKINILR